MKNLIKIFLLLYTSTIFIGCGKNEIVNIETTIPKGVSYTKATIGGTLNVESKTPILSAGICWSQNDLPTITDNKIDSIRKSSTYYFEITNLQPGKTYYCRAFVTTPHTTYYGSSREFKTIGVPDGSILDIDENVYSTITIGSQTWMMQNLKTTKYRNGDKITNIPTNMNWASSTFGAFCNYENTNSNVTKFGRLYNWFSINDLRNIAPEGWRIPTETDWQILINYLGGEDICGGKLKDQAIGYWQQPNTGATNESGFTARAGGHRAPNGFYQNILLSTSFWTSSPYDSDSAVAFSLVNNSSIISKTIFANKTGLSVRCLKE